MGIFTKLSTLVRSNINDAIAKAENPEKMLNQVLLDMREQLAKAKQEVAIAMSASSGRSWKRSSVWPGTGSTAPCSPFARVVTTSRNRR
jgi:hypothetical protein